MKNLKILEQVYRHQWAITPQALECILSVLEGATLSSEDYEIFHQLGIEERESYDNYFGESLEGSSYASISGDTGFLLVDGPIIPRATMFSRVSGMVDLKSLRSDFKMLEAIPNIQNIVHLYDTPGGVVQGVSDYAALVKASQKNTYSFTWMAASAGYDMAAASDYIVSPESGMVGSVGTILSLTDFSKRDEKRGVKHITVVSNQSPKKRPNLSNEEELAPYQELVDDLSSQFIERLAVNRNTTVENVSNNFGQGATYVAQRALKVGMIDRIQDLEAFAYSLGQSNRSTMTVFSQQTTNSEDLKMEKDQKVTVEMLRMEHPTLIAEIAQEAALAERQRLQEIESLLADFSESLPGVKNAATKAVNDRKWSPEATKGSVAAEVVGIISKAQVLALKQEALHRESAGDFASHASEAELSEKEQLGGGADPEGMDQGTVNNMLAAAKREGRIQ